MEIRSLEANAFLISVPQPIHALNQMYVLEDVAKPNVKGLFAVLEQFATKTLINAFANRFLLEILITFVCHVSSFVQLFQDYFQHNFFFFFGSFYLKIFSFFSNSNHCAFM